MGKSWKVGYAVSLTCRGERVQSCGREVPQACDTISHYEVKAVKPVFKNDTNSTQFQRSDVSVSKLVPEQPLVISPTLAATIGLGEAVMLQVLAELIRHRGQQRHSDLGLRWLCLEERELPRLFPFWSMKESLEYRQSLQNLGVLKLEHVSEAQSVWIAIDDGGEAIARAKRVPPETTETPKVKSALPVSERLDSGANAAKPIPDAWQPEENWIRLARQHAIPEDFIRSLIPEFVNYWRDRRQARFSWGNAFYKHVLKEWRHEQTRKGARELASTMSPQWLPSADALEILGNVGISHSFIEDAIPEFVLYWRERGVVHGAWNTKFIEHIRRQWAKYMASFGLDDTPRRIADGWQPSADCFEILQLAEIDEAYARSKVPEFVLYWKDSEQVKASWNTVFLQFIKQDWARRLKQGGHDEKLYGEDQTIAGTQQQKIREKFERIADRSWAD